MYDVLEKNEKLAQHEVNKNKIGFNKIKRFFVKKIRYLSNYKCKS